MKITQYILLTLLFISIQFIPYLSAAEYNRWQLPEGAKLRLGKGLLYDIKFTPDGNRIAVATSIGIWIYDAQTRKELALLTGHTRRVTSMDFPADGRFLVSGSFDGTVRLWDIDTGKQISVLAGQGSKIKDIAVSLDGKTVASGSWNDGTLILWDTETGEQIKRHTRYTDNLIHRFKIALDKSWSLSVPNAIETLAFSPDGKTLASGHSDGIVRLWDAETGRKLSTLKEHKRGSIRSLAFSPDGKTLASSTSGEIRLRTLQKGKLQSRLTMKGKGAEHLVFSPDSQTLISNDRMWSGRRNLLVWRADTGERLRSIPIAPTGQLEALALLPDGNTIVTGGWDGTIRQWDLATGRYLSTFATGHDKHGGALWFSEDGQTLISWSREEQQFWDIATGAQISVPEPKTAPGKQSRRSPRRAISARIVEDGKSIQIQDDATGREMYRITGHKGNIWTFAYSPDGKTLASSGADGTIRLWDLATGNEILILGTQTYQVSAIAFSPDGKILAGGSVYDRDLDRLDLIRLWELPSRRILTTFAGHTGGVGYLRFSNDGKTLGSISGDGTLLLWDLDKIR